MNHPTVWKLLQSQSEPEYRLEYLRSLVRVGLAQQLRVLRGTLSQEEFARKIGAASQSVVSERLENPDYTGLKVDTLLEIANALDIGLLVRFVDYSEAHERMTDLSPTALAVKTYDETMKELEEKDREAQIAAASFLLAPSFGSTETTSGVGSWTDTQSSLSPPYVELGKTTLEIYTPTT